MGIVVEDNTEDVQHEVQRILVQEVDLQQEDKRVQTESKYKKVIANSHIVLPG